MRRALILLLMTVLGAAMVAGPGGCSTETTAPSGVAVAAGAPAKGAETAAVPEALATAVNDFGFDLLRAVDAEASDTNAVISPFSVHDALSMTANGADGDTLAQMRDALAYGTLDEPTGNQAWADLITALRSDGATVTVANSLWLQEGYPFGETFLATDGDYFGAEIRGIDLQAEGADNAINEWVSENTNGKIEKIVDSIDPQAVMYLVNATYFKAAWLEPFDAAATDDQSFSLDDGSSADIPFMHRSGEMDYAAVPAWKMVRLPYSDSSVAMYIILPSEATNLQEFEAGLTANEFRSMRTLLMPAQGTLSVPKVNTSYERELSDDLIGLGMSDAFSDENADFSRMAETGDALWIGKVNHKTFLSIDEAGTEAAAATSVEMLGKSAPTPGMEPFEMVCDRPFLTLIVHEPSGTVLFAGAIRDPRS